MGHIKAAHATEEALRKFGSEIDVRNINVLDFGSLGFKKFFEESYNFLSTKVPDVWRMMYEYFDVKARQSKIPVIISKLSVESKLIGFIKEFKPDFIISTHPFPIQLLTYAKRQDIIDIPSANVITDYGCHRLWVNDDVNYYFAATDYVKDIIKTFGVTEEKVVVSGIPIEEKFQTLLPREAALKKIGFEKSVMTVLIVGGRLTFSDLKKIVNGLLAGNLGLYCIIVCGRDKKLETRLVNAKCIDPSRVLAFGFVEKIQDLMAASDVIISKAGGLTVSECLACALPMIIYKIIPGQEEDNADFLERIGAGIRLETTGKIISWLNDAGKNKNKLNEMSYICATLGKPYAARAIAECIRQKLA